MYCLTFYPLDGGAREEYYYQNRADAEYHMGLFVNDNSGLYKAIEIEEV